MLFNEDDEIFLNFSAFSPLLRCRPDGAQARQPGRKAKPPS